MRVIIALIRIFAATPLIIIGALFDGDLIDFAFEKVMPQHG